MALYKIKSLLAVVIIVIICCQKYYNGKTTQELKEIIDEHNSD